MVLAEHPRIGVENTPGVPHVLAVAEQTRLESALKVVLLVPDKPKKIDTSLSGPMLADAWRGSARRAISCLTCECLGV